MRFVEAVDEVASMLAAVGGERIDLKDVRIPRWVTSSIQQVAQMSGSTAAQGRGDFSLRGGVATYKITSLLGVSSPDDLIGFHTVYVKNDVTQPIKERSADEVFKNIVGTNVPGVPSTLARWGDEVMFFPIPDMDTQVSALYWKGIKVDVDAEIPLPDDLHMPCVLYAAHIGSAALKDFKGSAAWWGILVNTLGTQRLRGYQSTEGRKPTMSFSLRQHG
jgi:hypothetical protein